MHGINTLDTGDASPESHRGQSNVESRGFPGRINSSRAVGETLRSGRGTSENDGRFRHESPDSIKHESSMQMLRRDSSDAMLGDEYTDKSLNVPESNTDRALPSLEHELEDVSVSAYRSTSAPRTEKFAKLLNERIVDVEQLRELSWSGIPPVFRPVCWRLLLGYVPPNRELQEQVLVRKRKEYKNFVSEYYDSIASISNVQEPSGVSQASDEENAFRQVVVDVPRTAPDVPFFHQSRIQKSLERILLIWGIRHPASGYVQGINDLATPFLATFTSEKNYTSSIENIDVNLLSDEEILDIEADSYWCLCKLLDGIQDHYTYAQPGIQKTLFHVEELVSRVEKSISEHFSAEGVQYMQFAFRWVNCLLLRELPFNLGIRIWDTYLSEGPGLKDFLIYILSSFLLSWTPELREKDFQEIIMFLQRCPTDDWTEREIELVLSRAFMWRVSFKDALSHFS